MPPDEDARISHPKPPNGMLGLLLLAFVIVVDKFSYPNEPTYWQLWVPVAVLALIYFVWAQIIRHHGPSREAWLQKNALILNKEGLVLGRAFYPWRSIERFGVVKDHTRAPLDPHVVYWVYRGASGKLSDVLMDPRKFGYEPKEFATILNALMEKETGHPPAPVEDFVASMLVRLKLWHYADVIGMFAMGFAWIYVATHYLGMRW
jgi:hypothetical protein